MDNFYKDTVDQLLRDGVIDKSDRVIVVAGGFHDRDTLMACGLENVTISNLDDRLTSKDYEPFQWSFQDGEGLTFEDDEFDFCIEHNGLHHCHSPHKAITEMYRVAKKGLLLFEPYDNMVTRLGVRLGIGQDYEHAAVFHNNMTHGGVRNTHIPNYIYRLTRREIVKTVQCFAPYGENKFTFFHKMRVPLGTLKSRKNKLTYLAALMATPFLKAFCALFPEQANCFAAMALKPDLTNEAHPWLRYEEGGKLSLNKEWLEGLYKH